MPQLVLTTALAGMIAILQSPLGAVAGELSQQATRSAVEKSLKLLQHSAATYIVERDCFSCHHQALPAMTMALAREHGFQPDADRTRKQSEFTHAYFNGRRDRLRQGEGVPGGPYTAGYALVSLAADKWPADETTGNLVTYLLKTQAEVGRWAIRTHRPPLEDSDFTATALSLRGLKLYAPAESSQDIADRVCRAREWLLAAIPQSNEDRAFRVFGLRWSESDAASLEKAVAELLAQQRDDGGWSQLADMSSDAYATGMSLVAVGQSGQIPVSHAAYHRGLEYLLQTQRADGSWRVDTRSKPIQTYFESGFPHAESQFISISATCWAVMALTLSTPRSEHDGAAK
jgi:N-acyl-D-amino-acid deacylase